MIIDTHTHYTTAPAQLQAYRGQQITHLGKPVRAKLQISDEVLARSMEGQFKRMKESGIDRLLFSPQASAMGHHFGARKPLLDGGMQRSYRAGCATMAG
jgi:4-oxalmesaconate hydratase